MIGETGATFESDTHTTITDILQTIDFNMNYNEGDIVVLALLMKNSKDERRKIDAKKIMEMKIMNIDNLRFFGQLLSRPRFNDLREQFSVTM